MVSIAAISLGVVFAWAGIAKAARARHWRANLRAYKLPRAARAAGFLLLPWVELAAAVALLAGRPALGGAVASVLIAIFFIAIIRARLVLGSDKLGCACFGTTSIHDYRLLLLRNAALGALTAYLLVARPIGEVRGPGLPGAGPAMFATGLGLVGLACISWLTYQLVSIRREASVSPVTKAV